MVSDNKTTDRDTSELSDEDLDAVLQESARQEMDDFQGSLQEREKGLRALEEAQQLLEDELEDANTEVDRLQRELDKAIVEAEESEYLRKEAEDARKKLEATLYNIQEGVEDAKVTDLRDERMHQTTRSLDMGMLTRGPFWKGVVAGLVFGSMALILLIDIILLVSGKTELFKHLFG